MLKRFLCLLLTAALCSLFPYALAVNQGNAAKAEKFADVPETSPYHDAIYWASSKNITKGTDETHFSPGRDCSRANIITFIWRYSDGKEVSGVRPYADVKPGCYYEDASHWAFINGLETGRALSGKYYFEGGTSCTRYDAVKYFWLLEGGPIQSEYENYAKPFRDVKDCSLETRMSIGWAVKAGITNGKVPDLFYPGDICTRGQIATFLYRYDQWKNA